MSAINDTDAELAAIRNDLSNLKGDVASLIEHFTGEVGSGVQGVSNQITEGVRCVSENPAANGKQTAKAIGLWVERRPHLSLGEALPVARDFIKLAPAAAQSGIFTLTLHTASTVSRSSTHVAPKWAKRRLRNLRENSPRTRENCNGADPRQRGLDKFQNMRSRRCRSRGLRPGEPGRRRRGGCSMKALRTLIVEDDATIGGLLAETLEGFGHRVCAVETNVANAVAAASRCRPDLMIVDVGLGEASGIAAVKEILRSGFVPHVFVTGDAVRGVPLGPDTVLIRKPFRVSDLDQAIQRALATALA